MPFPFFVALAPAARTHFKVPGLFWSLASLIGTVSMSETLIPSSSCCGISLIVVYPRLVESFQKRNPAETSKLSLPLLDWVFAESTY